ncbi:MAG: hypothetical protein ABSF72_16805 [Candidatus Sulfotelmatobacter sp.]|jgi:hypothetical protein
MPLSSYIHSVGALRIAAITVGLFCLLMMSGCWMFSLQPLFDGGSDPDLIFDESLVGAWGHEAEDCQWTLTVQASAGAYNMAMGPGAGCKTDEKSTRYLAYLVKVDNHRFLDVSPKQSEVCDLCLSVHTFALLSLENNTLSLTPLDGDWLDRTIKEKKVAVAYVGGERTGIDITLNARPAELKTLLRTYANDSAAFKPSGRLVFTRK